MGDSERPATSATSEAGSPVRAARPSKQERRLELVEAAIRAIRRGDRSLSMNDLAAEAGITKPILYRHFGDRRGLVNAISIELMRSLVDLPAERLSELSRDPNDSILETVVPRPDPTIEGFERFLDGVVDAFMAGAEREPELFRFVMKEDGFRTVGEELNPGLVPGSQMGHTLSRLLVGVLEDAPDRQALADSLGQAMACALEGGVRWWSTTEHIGRDEMAKLLSEFLRAGVRGVLEARKPA